MRTESPGKSLPRGKAEMLGSMNTPMRLPSGITSVAPATPPSSVSGAIVPVMPMNPPNPRPSQRD